MNPSEAFDRLLDMGVSEETLVIISAINGHNLDTYQDVLFAKFGYRSFEQMDSE